ncbi:tRNA (N(6)-L-threonylcarbamoyladenosine(37)-C(2))-methylthiotransferase MtaB [Chromatium okenii]|uniref:tRNA (N(6)-L-threonylcarbamoyladenosine(37)-C(2))-methylthiotransferase MtaB n=1 Tax=Chromatium okenii TaxID=61644 RepID=A0A2S7XPI9_9GAMM|nr:tRNA (N(6)-L-threonylcarbamoyladenosine(37)-C(2))-methylthiotransferase MtaB [Chromatium okenii]PQJ95586.1 tRNA (N(6)-L-threonylcarbamoyladenosine(37)-C(2))-methylthiotransferase MtaB [Chromatium okenii]
MFKQIKLLTLGCRLNEAELENWADDFYQYGFEIVNENAPADLIVINTCAVTAQAVRKSRQLLRQQQRNNPNAQLIVSGCLATLEATALAQERGVTLLIKNSDKDQLVDLVMSHFFLTKKEIRDDFATPLFARNRQRAFIKAQDGCRYQCTFCITTQARGVERSRPRAEIVNLINRLQKVGIWEVVLTGVQLCGYGSDCGDNLTALVAHLLAVTTIPRLRLGSLEPWDLPIDFWALFANSRLLPHLHLPLQSGSDAVLRRMGRRCKAYEFMKLVEIGRAQVPGLNLTTDIIVGFPGETVADWQQTLQLVESAQFGHVHIFNYSPRTGTIAATLPHQIDAAIKKQRSEELKMLAQKLKQQVLTAQIGQQVTVLIEGADAAPTSVRFGYTPNYLPVRIKPLTAIGEHRLIDVQLTD